MRRELKIDWKTKRGLIQATYQNSLLTSIFHFEFPNNLSRVAYISKELKESRCPDIQEAGEKFYKELKIFVDTID